MVSKTGVMVGIGETTDELLEVFVIWPGARSTF